MAAELERVEFSDVSILKVCFVGAFNERRGAKPSGHNNPGRGCGLVKQQPVKFHDATISKPARLLDPVGNSSIHNQRGENCTDVIAPSAQHTSGPNRQSNQ